MLNLRDGDFSHYGMFPACILRTQKNRSTFSMKASRPLAACGGTRRGLSRAGRTASLAGAGDGHRAGEGTEPWVARGGGRGRRMRPVGIGLTRHPVTRLAPRDRRRPNPLPGAGLEDRAWDQAGAGRADPLPGTGRVGPRRPQRYL